MINTKDKISVVCLSNQAWDFELWTNKKHIMSELKDRLVNVLYVDPPLRYKILIKILKKRISIKQLFVPVTDNKNLKVFSPFRLSLVSKVSYFMPVLDHLYIYYTAFVINKFLKNTKGKKVLWVYHVSFPGLEKLLSLVQYDLLIYDLVDDYATMPEFSNISTNKWLINRENWLIKKSDIIFTSAPGLFNKYSKLKNNVYYIPNAGAFEIFSNTKNLSLPDAMKPIVDSGKKIVGFTGALDAYKVNLDLVQKLVEFYPDFNFVFVGPINLSDNTKNLEKLKLLHNVFLLPSVPKPELASYYKFFDTYIIPYNLNQYTKGCFPVKFFDALSSRLPVVVTNMQAYSDYRQVCCVAKDDNEFIELVKTSILENTVKKQEERVKIASVNTWSNKLDKQLKIICSD